MGLLDGLWISRAKKERLRSKIQRVKMNMQYYKAITAGALFPVYEKAMQLFPEHLSELPHSPKKEDYESIIRKFVSEDFTLAAAVNHYLEEEKEPEIGLRDMVGEDVYNKITAHPEAIGYFVERFDPEKGRFLLIQEEVMQSSIYRTLATEKAELDQTYQEVKSELDRLRRAGRKAVDELRELRVERDRLKEQLLGYIDSSLKDPER